MSKKIAKFCPQQFLNYHKCMSDPNVKDVTECIPFQGELAKCIKSDVPSFQKIQDKCADVMKDYETCIRSKGKTSECIDQLNSLRNCAQRVVQK